MKKTKLVTFIIIFAVILIGAIFFYLGQHREPTNQINVNNNPQENVNTTEEKLPEILGNKDDLVSFSIVSGSTISGKMAVSGIVKNAYFFEGNILLNVLDQNKNVLKTGHGSAITDWMTSGPVSFQGIIDTLGLPTGAAYIEIRNDNPSGMPENNKSILIPVVIGDGSVSTYIYKNHGFTIELPKSFTMPAESRLENDSGVDMDVYVITLPKGYLSYTTSAPWWEKNNIAQYKYVKDEKIGETTFKVYTYKDDNGFTVYYYWFKKGNVGYEFRFPSENDKNILSTFKFVGWSS